MGRPARTSTVVVRAATESDLPTLARLGARLSRMHHRLDPRRFFVVPGMEQGYAWWLGQERRNRKAVVLAAVRIGPGGKESVVGYAYGRIEPRDWNSLREACGVGIDLMVEPRARVRGVGRALVEALTRALTRRGAPRVVIQVASRNPEAQAFFARLGFRPTMLEMAKEAPGRSPGPRPSPSSPAASPAARPGGRASGKRSRHVP
jgi:ribosomal protein S18 acetylase RimI-like enzyme